MAIFTILYGNYHSPYGDFKLICIGKFARRTWVNFTQQYAKNRQRCRKIAFYYAVWQLLLYFYSEFPSKILSVYTRIRLNLRSFHLDDFMKRNYASSEKNIIEELCHEKYYETFSITPCPKSCRTELEQDCMHHLYLQYLRKYYLRKKSFTLTREFDWHLQYLLFAINSLLGWQQSRLVFFFMIFKRKKAKTKISVR